MRRIESPIKEEELMKLKAGDRIFLSGTLYTARDAAHKRMAEALECGLDLPVDLKGQTLYYVGPTPARDNEVIGAAGPTTSGRMDAYTPALLNYGLKAMIGKGQRSSEVCDAIVEHSCVYLAAIGGAAALIADAVTSCEIIGYEDLGTEAIRKLTVENLPLIVAIDACGRDYYSLGREAYLKHAGGDDYDD